MVCLDERHSGLFWVASMLVLAESAEEMTGLEGLGKSETLWWCTRHYPHMPRLRLPKSMPIITMARVPLASASFPMLESWGGAGAKESICASC
jgi:hypothetical protein